jgi:hypothetical protein
MTIPGSTIVQCERVVAILTAVSDSIAKFIRKLRMLYVQTYVTVKLNCW